MRTEKAKKRMIRASVKPFMLTSARPPMCSVITSNLSAKDQGATRNGGLLVGLRRNQRRK